MRMRSRPNAAPGRPETSNGDGLAKRSTRGEVEKVQPKFKRPPKAFSLPSPPKLSSLSVQNGAVDKRADASVPKVNDVAFGHNGKSSEHNASENLAANCITSSSSTGTSALPPVKSIPIPLPPLSTSAVYQRANRKPQTSDTNSNMANMTTETASKTIVTSGSITEIPPPISTLRGNSYPAQRSQIQQPYKPSTWYADQRNIRRRRRIANTVFGAAVAIFLFFLIWWGYQQYLISLQNMGRERRNHKRYHHHDHHHDFHLMTGIVESPLGFAIEAAPKERTYRQMEQEDTHGQSSKHEKGASKRDIFSTFPVTTLNDKRLLPYVGFGVSSRSVEHKQIPAIVSTLLQYASSETEGGGGIAMIDACIDESRRLENDGGSLQYSISNKVVERYEEEEEKLESSMAKTVVSLVGRAIGFFGKQRSKRASQGADPHPKDDGAPYDYENRLEVHLLVGLSGPDLGVAGTVAALQLLVAELDGLVPVFPGDAFHAESREWETRPSSLPTADRRVDVRLHVLLRMNHCHDPAHPVNVVPCSSDGAGNKEMLERFIGSYTVLERLYSAKVIHGLGLDGMHGEDVQYLLERCKIKPQLYRGDVSQALDIVRRNHHKENDGHLSTILKENNITFLASNVAGHILERKDMAPNAYALLQGLGGVLYRAHHKVPSGQPAHDIGADEGGYYTVSRIVLSYLVRHGICVLPHAYKAQHLADDAPESVGGLAGFLTERRVAEVGMALLALLSEEDLEEDHGMGAEGEDDVVAVFHNTLAQEVHVVEKVGVSNVKKETKSVELWADVVVKGGGTHAIITDTAAAYVVYGADQEKLGDYEVTAKDGGANDFTIPSSI